MKYSDIYTVSTESEDIMCVNVKRSHAQAIVSKHLFTLTVFLYKQFLW